MDESFSAAQNEARWGRGSDQGMLALARKRPWLTGLALAAITLAILFVVSLFVPYVADICAKGEYSGNKECAPHYLGPFALLWLASVINKYNGLVIALGTIAVAAFTWTLWRTSDKQAQLTRESIDLAREAFAAEHRTGLKIYPVKIGPLTYMDNEIWLQVTYEVKNVGAHPAVFVSPVGHHYRTPGAMIGRDQMLKLIEQEKMWRDLPAAGYGMALLPNETTQLGVSGSLATVPTIEARVKERLDTGDLEKVPETIDGAAYGVIYKSPASKEWRYTANVMIIAKAGKFAIDPADGDIPEGQLRATVMPDHIMG
ncbi:MAG TPA: hypothetical protein VHW69_07690 [Rhizomicrobium sp.]|nr:hypothetical protein [Rhizomicrobium sp.]